MQTQDSNFQSVQAHHPQHAGLRAHSVGDVYPVVIVRYGDDSAGMIVGSKEFCNMPKQHIDELARSVKLTWDDCGVDAAQGLAATIQWMYDTREQ